MHKTISVAYEVERNAVQISGTTKLTNPFRNASEGNIIKPDTGVFEVYRNVLAHLNVCGSTSVAVTSSKMNLSGCSNAPGHKAGNRSFYLLSVIIMFNRMCVRNSVF